ncbi:MAG: hypothetical protein R6W06_00055 [Prochlorococcaceae cyanobacterium]
MDEDGSDNLLSALLDGPFRTLRDRNHVDLNRILVWDQDRQPVIQAVLFLELLGRYPCGDDAEAQWSAEDLLEILQKKRELLRMSEVAHEISEERPRAQPPCGTVVLIINRNRSEPHSWVVSRARITPQLDEQC